MLFDLRGRGRRRTVQAVYLGLALLIGGGLVLFGGGTGAGGGGLLNGLTGNGSGGSQNSAVSQQEKTALKGVQSNPNSPQAWASLVQARWTSATTADYNQSTGAFTPAGQKELVALGQDWQHYLTLVKTPDPTLAILAAPAYAAKQTRKGDLALVKALSLAPKAQRLLLKTQITQAKTQPAIAQQC